MHVDASPLCYFCTKKPHRSDKLMCSFSWKWQWMTQLFQVLCLSWIFSICQAFNPHGFKKILGFHTRKISIIKTKQKRTSNTKQVFIGKAKHLLPEGAPPWNSWEGTTGHFRRHDNRYTPPLFAYIIFILPCSLCWILALHLLYSFSTLFRWLWAFLCA